jgi:hypothetical protein
MTVYGPHRSTWECQKSSSLDFVIVFRKFVKEYKTLQIFVLPVFKKNELVKSINVVGYFEKRRYTVYLFK